MNEFRVRPDRQRRGGVEILRLAGIPFYAELSFFIFIGLLIFLFLQWDRSPQQAGLLVILIFISLLAHEAGHAIMARLVGCREIFVSLIMFGGQTSHEPTTNGRTLLIVLAGPLTTLALMVIGLVLLRLPAVAASEPATFVCGALYFLNGVWFIFNMLPILPMDGGRTIQHTLAFFMREHRAAYYVSIISMAACVIAGALLFHYRIRGTFIFLFLVLFFLQNFALFKKYN